MERKCDVCATTYTAKRPSSRYCSDTCRKRAQRAGGVPEQDSQPLPTNRGGLLDVTERELREADRLDTVAGQAALTLARRLDTATADTGSSIAALVRQLEATMETAMRGVSSAADPIDELRRKRDQRRAAAG